MESLSDETPFFKQLLKMLEMEFGDRCEIVLHDLTRDYEHTIVDIRNGNVTGRKAGGAGTNLGLEVLNGSTEDGDRFNYVTNTPDGKVLRSSSIYIKNSEGKVIGSICINLDITDSIKFEGALHKYNRSQSVQDEFFAHDVGSLLDYMISQISLQFGKPLKDLNKAERLEFIRALDEHGAFRISKAGDKVCETLGISKYTLYSDLDRIRGNLKTEQ
jgi:predicted transcriptional regulator YheO